MQGWKDLGGREIEYPSTYMTSVNFCKVMNISTLVFYPNALPKFRQTQVPILTQLCWSTIHLVAWISFSLSIKLGQFYLPCRAIINIKWDNKVYKMLSMQHLINVSTYGNLSLFSLCLAALGSKQFTHHFFQKLYGSVSTIFPESYLDL
jgi:hypothetical protein